MGDGDIWIPNRRLAWRAAIPAILLVPGLGLLGWVLADQNRLLFVGAFVMVGVVQFAARCLWWSLIVGRRRLEARAEALVIERRFGKATVMPWAGISRVVLDPGDRRPEWGDFPTASPMVDFPDFVAYGDDPPRQVISSPGLFAPTPKELDRLRRWLGTQCADRGIAFESASA